MGLGNLAGRTISYALADKCPYKDQCYLGSMCHKVEQEVLDCSTYQSKRDFEDNMSNMLREEQAIHAKRERESEEMLKRHKAEMKQRAMQEKADDLLHLYYQETLPYLIAAQDILEGRTFEYEPKESDYIDALDYAKFQYNRTVPFIPMIKEANDYLSFCQKHKLTPKENVSEQSAKLETKKAYVKYYERFFKYGETAFAANQDIQNAIQAAREEFKQRDAQEEKARLEKEAAEEAAKAEAERIAAEKKRKAEEAKLQNEQQEDSSDSLADFLFSKEDRQELAKGFKEFGNAFMDWRQTINKNPKEQMRHNFQLMIQPYREAYKQIKESINKLFRK